MGSVAGEIERIVNSPYPTQLKSLRDALQRDGAVDYVARWSLAKPCQVQNLTRCVLDGLQHWPYVLEIVAKLCRSKTVRDSFLAQQPGLLHDIILRAVQANDLDSLYTATALAMLSHRLPDHISMPADAQALFVQVFDFAARNASATTLKSVYQLLRGSSAHLLSILSGKVLIRFEDHIFEILRNVRGDTSSLSLHCLAVLRVMLSAADDQHRFSISSYDTQDLLASVNLSSSQKWNPDAVQQFFNGEKAQKTLQLVILRAMWACTSSSEEHLDDRLRSLQLANEIIETVSGDVRNIWRKSNALLIRKLEEKVMATGLDPTLRFRGLYFLLQVNRGGFCPALVMDGLRQALIKPADFRQAVVDGEVLHVDQLSECGVFDQTTTISFLQNLVDFITTAHDSDISELSKPLRQVLGHLSTVSSHDEGVVEGAMLALDVLSCGDKLQQLRAATGKDVVLSGVSKLAICHQAVEAGQNGLVHDLVKLFLTASMCPRQASLSISRDTRSLLLDIYAASVERAKPCSHARSASLEHARIPSVVQVSATPGSGQADWRHDMANHFAARARSDEERLFSIFHRAVSDLESRCEEAEKPLLVEQDLRRGLQKKFDDLSQAYTNLENDGINKDIQFNALEAERNGEIEELGSVRAEVDDLMARVDALVEELRVSNESIEKMKKASAESNEEEELRHAALRAKTEDESQRLREQLRCTFEDLETTRREADSLGYEMENQKKIINEARAKESGLSRANFEMQIRLDRQQGDLQRMKEYEQGLEVQLREKEQELAETSVAHQVELSSLKQRSQVEMEGVVEDNMNQIAKLATQCDSLTASEHEVRRELDDSHRAVEHQKIRVEKRDRRIADLQKETDRLHRKCEQKDQQIADASVMRNNLMMAMGLGDVQPQPQSSLPHRPYRVSSAQRMQRVEDNSQDPSPPTPFSVDDEKTQHTNVMTSFVSNVSSQESRGGPTPKRAKVRRSIKIKTPAKQRLSAVSTRSARATTEGLRRQPLLTLGPSAGNKRSGIDHTPRKEVADMGNETTFDGSESFEGTPAGGRVE